MNKKFKTFLLMLISVAVCVASFSVFTACGGEKPIVDPSETVYSNGGTVVEYDGWVYFINGIPDYTDESGNTNKEGKVVKGGLYRAQLVPDHGTVAEEQEKPENMVKDDSGNLVIDTNADNLGAVLNFKYEKWDYIKLGEYSIGNEDGSEPALETGADGKLHQNKVATNGKRSEYRIAVEPVINKKIGTSGYSDGGFWIYDGYIFFASPDNSRNSSGDVQYERAEFFCYDIEKGALTQIRTATEVNAALPYTFKKYNGSVYLVTYESYYENADAEKKDIKTTHILSTKITNGKVGETTDIVSGATSVYFPKKETYNPDDKTNTAEDYIYYTRQNDTDGFDQSSTTLEMIALDGTRLADKVESSDDEEMESVIAVSTNGNITIEGVAGGYLYYRYPDNKGNTGLRYDNLSSFLNIYDSTLAVENIAGTLVEDASEYDSYIPLDGNGKGAYVLAKYSGNGKEGEGVYNISVVEGNMQTVLLASGSINVLGVHNGLAYGMYQSFLNSFNAFTPPTDKTKTFTLIGMNQDLDVDPFKLDFFDIHKANKDGQTREITDSYVAYFGEYHAAAKKYMMISRTNVKYQDSEDVRVALPLGQEIDSEHRVISCYDETCLNWLHDHTSWDKSQGTDGDEDGEDHEHE